MGAIHDSAADGDLVKIRELLEIDPKLVSSKASPDRLTPLHAAIRAGQKEAAAFLISHGADMKKEKGRGLAIIGELLLGDEDTYEDEWEVDWELVEFCMAQGVNVNGKVAGTPLLHTLADSERPDLVEWWLSQGAKVNATDGEGHTALYVATKSIEDMKSWWPADPVYRQAYIDAGHPQTFRKDNVNILKAHGGTGEYEPPPLPVEPHVFTPANPITSDSRCESVAASDWRDSSTWLWGILLALGCGILAIVVVIAYVMGLYR